MLVHAEPEQEFQLVRTVDQQCKMRLFIVRRIRTRNQQNDFETVIPKTRANHALDVSRHILDKIDRETRKLEGGLIDLKFFMNGHAEKK